MGDDDRRTPIPISVKFFGPEEQKGIKELSIPVWPNVVFLPTGRLILEILEYYPHKSEIYITSGNDGDHGPRPYGSHHYGLSFNGSPTAALDIGGGGYNPAGSAKMKRVCQWLWQFRSSEVELIHNNGGSGFYIKNERVVGPYAAADHLNHVHLAMSTSECNRVLALFRAPPAPVPVPPPRRLSAVYRYLEASP